MTITNGYTDLATLKNDLKITDSNDDATLESKIEDASRWIDNECKRRFYTTAVDETRYYTARNSDYLLPDDDIISISTLQTDEDGDRVYERTWAATDYDLEPYNAALDGEPYTKLSVAPNGNYSFPAGVSKGVKIIGKFGYGSTIPKAIVEGCLLYAAFLFRHKDAPMGIQGGEMGTVTVRRGDLEAKSKIAYYRKLTVG